MQALILALALVISPEAPVPGDGHESAVHHSTDRVLAQLEAEIEAAKERGAFEPPVVEPAVSAEPEEPAILETDIGEATFYGGRFHGRRTASGERFDQTAMTAAHRTYPFGTIVRVTNLNNGRSVVLRINDRGPYGKAKKAARKIIDVSRAAADSLRFIRDGRIVAKVEVLEWGLGR